jgi:hypothetical protein
MFIFEQSQRGTDPGGLHPGDRWLRLAHSGDQIGWLRNGG